MKCMYWHGKVVRQKAERNLVDNTAGYILSHIKHASGDMYPSDRSCGCASCFCCHCQRALSIPRQSLAIIYFVSILPATPRSHLILLKRHKMILIYFTLAIIHCYYSDKPCLGCFFWYLFVRKLRSWGFVWI